MLADFVCERQSKQSRCNKSKNKVPVVVYGRVEGAMKVKTKHLSDGCDDLWLVRCNRAHN